MNTVLFAVLESRTMLSGDSPEPRPQPEPKPTPEPAILEADRAKITLDVNKLKSDFTTYNATLTAARTTRDSHRREAEAQLKSLRAKSSADEKAMKTERSANEDAFKAFRTKWGPVIGPVELDVRTNTEGETEEERAADVQKLTDLRAAAKVEYETVRAEMTSDRARFAETLAADKAAIEAARQAAESQRKTDSTAVSTAESALRSVFQRDRAIVEADVKTFVSHGGKTKDLVTLVTLPKFEAVSRK